MPWSGRLNSAGQALLTMAQDEGLRCVKRLTGAAAPVNRATVQDATLGPCSRVRHGGASAGPNGGHLLGHKEP
jgi:hypothetical protein